MDPLDMPHSLYFGSVVQSREPKSGHETTYYANLETGRMFSSEEETNRKIVSKKTQNADLPPGWIKEIKVTHNGHKSRRDAYYRDPITGYVFRSRVSVLRYLETGKRIKRVRLPKRKPIINNQNLNLPSSQGEKQRVEYHSTTKQLFEGNDDERRSIIPLNDDDMVSVEGGMVISPIVEIAADEHSVGKVIETKANSSLYLSTNEVTKKSLISTNKLSVSVDDKLPKKVSVESGSEKSIGIGIKTMELNDPLQDQPTQQLETETPIFLPFGDSSLDPCLEFAYKTLTGAISLDDIANDGTISTPVERNFDMRNVDNAKTLKALKSIKKEMKFPGKSSKVNNSKCGVIPIDMSKVGRSRTFKAENSKKNELKLPHKSIKEFFKDTTDQVENCIYGVGTRGAKLDVECQYPSVRNSSLPPATGAVITSGVGQNSNFSLPVFGMPYLPKCDLSPFFPSLEKQSESNKQQLPLNPSRLSPTNVSNSKLYCSNTDPLNRCVDGSCETREIHGKEE